MTKSILRGNAPSVHRIDLSCEQTDFSTPPYDVHIKFLPTSSANPSPTLLARTTPGKPELLREWLLSHSGFRNVLVAPGLAPKLLRATCDAIPPGWTRIGAYAKIHHLDLSSEGHAAWFVEGMHDDISALVQYLESSTSSPLFGSEVRCRPVYGESSVAPISRRQFEALSAAVALGYYEIPHRIDLRILAARTGVSPGSVCELLRRAEGAILTHYIDSNLMRWPVAESEALLQTREPAIVALN